MQNSKKTYIWIIIALIILVGYWTINRTCPPWEVAVFEDGYGILFLDYGCRPIRWETGRECSWPDNFCPNSRCVISKEKWLSIKDNCVKIPVEDENDCPYSMREIHYYYNCGNVTGNCNIDGNFIIAPRDDNRVCPMPVFYSY